MADFITLNPTKGMSLRRTRASTGAAWTDNWECAQGDQHICGGYSQNDLNQFRHLLQFTMPNWDDIETLVNAKLHIWSTNTHPFLVTRDSKGQANIKCAVAKNGWVEAGGGENTYTTNLPDHDADYDDNHRSYGVVKPTPGTETIIELGPEVRYWMKASVNSVWGKGLAKANNGIVIGVAGSSSVVRNHEFEAASHKHPDTSLRPFLILQVIRKAGPGVVTLVSPSGDVASGTALNFTGEYEPGAPDDKIERVTLQFSATGEATTTWEHVATNNEVATSSFSVPDRGLLKSGITYTWTAKVRNQRGVETPYAVPTSTVRLTTTPPSLVVAGPSGTLPNLDSVEFRATYQVPAKQYHASSWQVQLRPQTGDTDPTWEDGLLWDTGWMTVSLSAEDQTPAAVGVTQVLSTLYGGPALLSASYSFRMRARDPFGGTSVWAYGGFALSDPYIPPTDDDRVNLTRYGKPPPFRIRIFAVDLTAGKRRAPGKLLAELTDAANIGASEFYNSPGEFYFTLPAIHPQASAIEPYQCHYALEIHTGQGWTGKAFGLITDFDATEDEVVFYGQDYLGILSRAVEERFNAVSAEMEIDKGGAKYNNKTVKQIVVDQLTTERNKVNSPIGFININPLDIAEMAEQVIIYASFKQRLPFIAGLIDSSRAGTGKRTRLVCERNADGTFRWRVLSAPGLQRDNIRLEYGGLVQGFRTIPFSDWGTRVAAIGRTVLGTKVYSELAVAKGIDEAIWGTYPTTALYSDIDDLNDLRRRATQAAAKVAKVGKMMGIGLRVGSLGIKDGWDITDSVKVDIKRGVVDTSRFGSGYWTIWGWTWSSSPDGHTNLVLSLAPREDTNSPNTDIIGSHPILDVPDWQLEDRPPTAEDDGTFWLDTTTGAIYVKQPDGSWSLEGSMLGPPGRVVGPYLWRTSHAVPATGEASSLSTPIAGGVNAVQASKTGSTGIDQTSVLQAYRPGDQLVIETTTSGGGYGPDQSMSAVAGTPNELPASAPYTTGQRFTPLVDGQVTGIRYWANNVTGTVNVALWTDDGVTKLASASDVPGAGYAGWRTVLFAIPVAVLAGVTLRAAHAIPAGQSFTHNYATLTSASADLTAVGVGVYGGGFDVFPNATGDGWYWTDVVFQAPAPVVPGLVWRMTVTAAPVTYASYVSIPVTWPTGDQPSEGVSIKLSVLVPGPPGEAGGADTTVPGVPTISLLTSDVVVDSSGQSLVELRATIAHATVNADSSPLTDLFGTHVEFTGEYDPLLYPDPSVAIPIWDNAAIVLVGSTSSVGVLKGVAGVSPYWARARTRDTSGHLGAYSSPLAFVITTKDAIGPSVPSGLSAIGGFKLVGLTWTPSSAADLMFNEVRYAIDDGTGQPDVLAATWSPPALRVRTNTIVITDMVVSDPAKPYYFQVRAVDRSGNVVTSNVDPTPVDYFSHPEAGWSERVSATPTLVGSEDMAFDEVVTDFLTSGVINAGIITGGTLKIDSTGDAADGIEVWDDAVRVGIWNETGLYIGKNDAGLPDSLSKATYVKVADAGIDVFLAGQRMVVLTFEGLNATAITSGRLPGGMNLVKNSAFELAPFATAASTPKDWNVLADWTASQQTSTNATNGAGAVSATGTTY